MRPRISMITLGVKDVAASAAFYEALGLPRRESPPEVAFFPLNGTWLALFGKDDLAEDAGLQPQTSTSNNFALAHNLSSEAEVDVLLDDAKKAGATITKPAQKTSWGGYSGYFADPDGHLWEVAHNPHMWVGPPDED